MKTRFHNRYFFATDIILLAFAAYLSFVLRLETLAFDIEAWAALSIFLVIVLVITPTVFYWAGVYRRFWPYASTNEVLLLSGSVATATVLISLFAFIGHFQSIIPAIPRSIPFIFFLLALGFVAAPRLAVRALTQRLNRARPLRRLRPSHRRQNNEPAESLRVVIMGAGGAGAMIVRDLQQSSQPAVTIIGFLDDDPDKYQLRIHGVPVLGNRFAIPQLVQEHNVQQVIIAMPSAPGKEVRAILGICEQVGVQTKVIPGLYELIDGKVHLNQVRDVQIEDLLRREPIRTDMTALTSLLRGKRVLVTGGGGSIGSELCRQILRHHPAQLVILGHGENSIFEIHNELEQLAAKYAARAAETGEALPRTILSPVIADIRFANRIKAVFEEYRPQIVFHAAAHKHVPLMEYSPTEAITNNLLGTRYVLEGAQAVGVERFVMISTDKAVRPTSVMGATKRTAELLVHEAARKTGRHYMAVRFGNVLGSRGSVILTFKKQIARGGPITVTHPDMRRYFMTIPEAVQLVLQAGILGKGGEVFTLDMGEPVKIADLARDMIELSGLEVGRDIDIVYSGTRPGEKLYEELFTPGEKFERTAHEKIFIAANACDFVPEHLHHWIDSLAIAADRNDKEAILLVLRRLIPQHHMTQTIGNPHEQPLARELFFDELAQAAGEEPPAEPRGEERVRVVGMHEHAEQKLAWSAGM